MKQMILLGGALFFLLPAFSQSKKQVKSLGIKSSMETITDKVDGKDNTYKDLFKVYDKNGNLIEETEYKKDGNIKKRSTWKYDGSGNKIEETEFHPEKKIDRKTAYKYNSSGLRSEETEMDGNSKVLKKIVLN